MLATTGNLLQLDPDKLLATQSVEQAEGVARRLQKEVDSKREELRVMVGERYRDLIEAADTIQKMKASSFSVIQSLAEMQTSAHNLHQKTVAYNRPYATTDVGPSRANLPYLAVAASIKLLMSIPESIWIAVERGKLLQGAELYLLAQYVLTGLQGDMGAGVTADKVELWFPVVARQAATITNFHSSIIACAKDQLLAPELNPGEALDAVGALLLLRNGATAPDIFQEFLRLRQDCLRSRARLGRSESARAAMATLLRIVISTVNAVSEVFVEQGAGGGGGLNQLVERIASDTADPSLLLLGGSSVGPTGKFLPEPIKRFRPHLQFQDIPHQHIVMLTVEWLEQAQQCAVVESELLLADIHTIQGIGVVRQEVHSLLARREHHNWNSVIQATSGTSLNLWDSFYRESVRGRVEALLTASAAAHLAALEADLAAAAATAEAEQNLGPYIWSEAGADLGSLAKKQQQQPQQLSGVGEPALAMKCKGWSEAVQTLCRTFDRNMESLWTDVTSYNTGNSEDGETFDRYADSEVIYGTLGRVTGEGLAELVARLADDQVATSRPPEQLLLLARFLQAFPQLCGSLRTCLTAAAAAAAGAAPPHQTFASLETLLLDTSSKMFSLWSGQLLAELDRQLIDSSCQQLDLLAFFPAWDKTNVQERGEDEQEVTSMISIPSLPSVFLINSLHWIASRIHQAHPASMPGRVLNGVSQEILASVLRSTRSHLEAARQHVTQNLALQLAFNLKFVHILLLSREFKSTLGRELDGLVEEVESHVDPFDLSVFLPHLEVRVKRACARELSALGCLVPPDRFQLLASYKPSQPSTGSAATADQPNIMSLCTAPPQRFQLLPVASASDVGGSQLGIGGGTSRHGGVSSSLFPDPKAPAAAKNVAKRSRSPVSSTAASFFGSMSSSWFGGAANT